MIVDHVPKGSQAQAVKIQLVNTAKCFEGLSIQLRWEPTICFETIWADKTLVANLHNFWKRKEALEILNVKAAYFQHSLKMQSQQCCNGGLKVNNHMGLDKESEQETND